MAAVYGFSLKDKRGNEVSLETCKGKVLLIVNTTTGCGFTPRCEELEAMYRSLKEEDLEILNILCGQFGHQAPGIDEEIHEFCTARFGTGFPQFRKSDVDGANELPLYTWSKSEKGYTDGVYEGKLAAIMEDLYDKANAEPRKQNDIQWDLTKFLVSRSGEVVARFEPIVDLKEIQKAVETIL